MPGLGASGGSSLTASTRQPRRDRRSASSSAAAPSPATSPILVPGTPLAGRGRQRVRADSRVKVRLSRCEVRVASCSKACHSTRIGPPFAATRLSRCGCAMRTCVRRLCSQYVWGARVPEGRCNPSLQRTAGAERRPGTDLNFPEKDTTGEWINYEAAVSGGLQLVPTGPALEVLSADYDRMVADGMLLDTDNSLVRLMKRKHPPRTAGYVGLSLSEACC